MRWISLTVLLLGLILSSPTFAGEREIAITIDDLPFVGTNSNNEGNLRRSKERFYKILQALIDNQVPATGFIIAGSIGKNQWELLEAFRDAGLSLGNHTYSHANLNRMSAQQFISEISSADRILSPVMTYPKYFRYPYLAEGTGEKKEAVHQYLAANQYVIAPVTIDSKDYKFNERLFRINWRVRNQHLNKIKQQYLAYIWNQTLRAEKRSKNTNRKQILLIHANLLNSHFMGDIIQMYKQHGYRFITLEEALSGSDEAPIPEGQMTSLTPIWVSPTGREW